MHHKNFILHLTLIETIGPAIIQKIRLLLRQGFEGQERSDVNASDLYLFSQADWMNVFGFSEITAEKLVDGLANTKMLEKELELIAENNIQWATVEDETYPQLLKNIYLPPAVLYCMSSEALAKEEGVYRRIAVVGARKANSYGEYVVNSIIPDLVAAQYTIVSGGAFGIDTMAHTATIKNGGKTIAVLGSGLLVPYPYQNKKLFTSIVDCGGAMVSAFPLTMEALPGNFPARNRIITGLSRGCLVVQAAQKSGALISAHYAMEQGREVFAVPGVIGDELSIGCNTLIQQGAKLVMNAVDILEEFGDRAIIDKKVMQEKAMQMSLESAIIPAKKIAVSAEALAKEEHYSVQQKSIIFACKKPISFDALVDATQLTHETVQTELFNLQLDGVVEQNFMGMWVAQ